MKTGFSKTAAAITLAMVVGLGTAASAQMMSSHATAAPVSKSVQMANAPEITGKTVARVNGVNLLDRDLVREMFTIFPYAQQHNGFPKELEPQIRRGALQMIIFEELVYQEAKRRKLGIAPAKLAGAEKAFRKQFGSEAAYKEFLKSETNGSEAAMRERIRRSLLIDAFLKQEVETPARVSAVKARAEYQKNLAEYRHGEILRIQSISIVPPNETKAVREEAKKRAHDACEQAKRTKTFRDFGLLAEKISEDDYHVNMGDHKAQEAKTLPPPIVKAAAKMKVGDVSELMQFGNYYTIFRLESRVPAGVAPFAEVQKKLTEDLQKKNTEQLRTALAKKLQKNAKIETL